MYSIFESEITIRPDDIDMNNHVHYSKYLDYILAARYEQMHRDYQVSMEDFLNQGYTWFASNVNINYKRGLLLGDPVVVRTQVESYSGAQVTVNFWIVKKETDKVAADGQVLYTMISTKSGRPVRIPEEIIQKYTI